MIKNTDNQTNQIEISNDVLNIEMKPLESKQQLLQDRSQNRKDLTKKNSFWKGFTPVVNGSLINALFVLFLSMIPPLQVVNNLFGCLQ